MRSEFVLRFAETIEFGGYDHASESVGQGTRAHVDRGFAAGPSNSWVGWGLGERGRGIGAEIKSKTPQLFGSLFVANVPAELAHHRLQIFLNRDGRVLHFDTRRQERNFRGRTFLAGRGALLLAEDIVIARFAIAAYNFLRSNLRRECGGQGRKKG